MALINVLPEYLEFFSLRLHPQVNYVSSSMVPASVGTTGSMPLSARPSRYLKDLIDPAQSGENSYDSGSPGPSGFDTSVYEISSILDSTNKKVAEAISLGVSYDASPAAELYMTAVNISKEISRNSKKFEILRFDPPFTFNKNSTVKNIVRKVLMPFYRQNYDGCNFSYTNYNTINFVSASGLPGDAAIIYPNLGNVGTPRPYSPPGPFTFDFYINPRRTNKDKPDYHAGTILHLSSTYAVSLVSGSKYDGDGAAGTFRILLQLSHSADIAPHNINLNALNNKRSYPQDLVFLSDDNTLKKNHWHHVSIRWGGDLVNDGTGSIVIDNTSTSFNIPSSSILPPSGVPSSALVLGNYFDGFGNEGKFFNSNAATNEGVRPFEPGFSTDPENFRFQNILDAEIHDIKLFSKYLKMKEIKDLEKNGKSNTKDMMMYIPPFFTKDAPKRDVLITPFQTENRVTNHPFNIKYSFGVGGFISNAPNYLREFKNGSYPRLYNLTASTIDDTVMDITANGHVYGTGSMRARNLLILPNDNGRFIPDFGLLMSGTIDTSMSQFKSDLGGYDLSIVNIEDMVKSTSAYKGLTAVEGTQLIKAIKNEISLVPDSTSMNSIINQIAGVTPEIVSSLQGALPPGDVLTIYQRTRDPSSNEVVLFDISNIFYGNRILPGSFSLFDNSLSGSEGKVEMTIKDNGRGGLYRADCETPHAVWSNVGTVLYNEGLSVLKHPSVSYFGNKKYEAQFKGEQNIHMLTVNIPASVGMFNSSSNPSFKPVSASLQANEYDPNFVYITGFNIHDDNLNVIMRGTLAQPFKKRTSDDVLIKFKMDF